MNPNIKLVIGLVGKKNSGKDTVKEFLAATIINSSKLQVYRQAFADDLKHQVASLFGATDIDTINANKSHPVVRKALQDYGQMMREKDPEYWINQASKNLPFYQCPCIVIFTDVRHKNEADFIKKECSGILVRIRRSATDNSSDTHISETALESIQCDYIINNDWSLARLHVMCKDLVGVLRENGSLKI